MMRFSNRLVAERVQPFWEALQAGEFLTDAAAESKVSDKPRRNDPTIMADIDLAYRPRSYWPAGDPPDEPVVLAQISVDSVLGDLNTVTAEPTEENRIRFSLLSDEGAPIATLEPETADAPLSLGELIALIDTADIGGFGPGFVGGLLEMNSLLGTGNPQDANFVTVGSELYPGLGEHYDRQILAWVIGEDSGAP